MQFPDLRGLIGLQGGYIGIMEKKMETTIMGYIGNYIGFRVYFEGYIGIMEKKMETTELLFRV